MTKEPIAVTEIPADMSSVDLDTGKVTHNRSSWKVMPPPAGCCQICGILHKLEEPHNAQSLYYQMTFNAMIGRAPTWADAVAHCDPAIKQRWEAELRRRKAWSEPPKGEPPVKHHGVA